MSNRYVWLCLFALSLLFGACDTDREGRGPFQSGTGLISAQINGQFWSAPDGYMENVPPFGIRIRGVQGSQSEMLISISPYQGPNTYMLDGITTIEYRSGADHFRAINGQVTINSHGDEWIEGEFHGEFVSQTSSIYLSLTDGRFRVPLY